MKICIVHGYLLSGTGSNLYANNLARELSAAGHDVLIMCQESHPNAIGFVDEVYEFNSDNSSYRRTFDERKAHSGTCRVFRPDLNGKLLVYVHDKYDGLDSVKTFQEATPEEVEEYIERNATALKKVITDFKADIIITNHVIMQPYIAKMATLRDDIPYISTIHGSSLNFSVKADESLSRYALEGLAGAKCVVAVSDHCAQELREYIATRKADIGTTIYVVPAGVDTEIFKSHDGNRLDLLKPFNEALSKKLAHMNRGQSHEDKSNFESAIASPPTDLGLKDVFEEYAKRFDRRHPDRDVLESIESVDWEKDRVILFIGKYLWTKGVQCLICAAPLIMKKIPNAKFILTGFGGSKEALMALTASLANGNSGLFEFILENHMELDPGSTVKTPPVEMDFLNELRTTGGYNAYFETAKRLHLLEHIHFTGLMSHDELRYLLPMADVFAAPSIFPEAFGMVAAEAAASGVYPIITHESGFKEVNDAISSRLGNKLPTMSPLHLGVDFIPKLANNIVTVLKNHETSNPVLKRELSNLASERYGWQGIAKRYLQLIEA